MEPGFTSPTSQTIDKFHPTVCGLVDPRTYNREYPPRVYVLLWRYLSDATVSYLVYDPSSSSYTPKLSKALKPFRHGYTGWSERC